MVCVKLAVVAGKGMVVCVVAGVVIDGATVVSAVVTGVVLLVAVGGVVLVAVVGAGAVMLLVEGVVTAPVVLVFVVLVCGTDGAEVLLAGTASPVGAVDNTPGVRLSEMFG